MTYLMIGIASMLCLGGDLGHESIETTQKYLGIEQDFTQSPCDKLGLSLAA